MFYTPIAPLELLGSGKMPDLRRGHIVGFHGTPFNPTYLLLISVEYGNLTYRLSSNLRYINLSC